MKIGMIVESLRRPLVEGIRRARELGAEGIQIYAVSRYLDMLNDSPGKLKSLKTLANDNGLAVSAVCSDLGGHGFSDPAGNPERLEKTRRIMEAARVFETGVLTSHIGVVPTDTASAHYANIVETLRQAGRDAQNNGMIFAIETGPESPEALKQLLLDVDSKGVGVNMDPANLAMVQNCDPAEAVRLLAPYIVHTHAKDGVHLRDCDPARVYSAFAEGGFAKLVEETGELFREVELGKGQVEWNSYLAALKEGSFDGFLTIEREVGPDPDGDIASAIRFLREKLS
jgi:AP endonuclease, family 2